MSSNISGKAYALTLMCPIKDGTENNVAFTDAIRDQLESWNAMATSPMVHIPNTYLCRYYLLDDVYPVTTRRWNLGHHLRHPPHHARKMAAGGPALRGPFEVPVPDFFKQFSWWP